VTAASDGAPDRRLTLVAAAQARTGEQRHADAANAQEFHQIQKFVVACRRQWPGAPTGANAPINQNPSPEENGYTAVPTIEHILGPVGVDLLAEEDATP
jgi:hypothetical protein